MSAVVVSITSRLCWRTHMTVSLTHWLCNLVMFSSFIYSAQANMSVKMTNGLYTAPPVVPVLMAPHPGWMRHSKTQKILSTSAEGYWIFGDGQVLSGSLDSLPFSSGLYNHMVGLMGPRCPRLRRFLAISVARRVVLKFDQPSNIRHFHNFVSLAVSFQEQNFPKFNWNSLSLLLIPPTFGKIHISGNTARRLRRLLCSLPCWGIVR